MLWVFASYALIATMAFAACGTAFLVWPWSPAVGLVGACLSGAALSIALALLLPGRLDRDTPAGWRGVPARWLSSDRRGVRLAVASDSLADTIGSQNPPAEKRRTVVKENDAWDLGTFAVVVVTISSPVVWWLTHPVVHVVNTSYEPWAVYADGHALGVVAAVAGEAPNAAVDVRVPRGWRRLKAVKLDGTVVDEVEADVGVGEEQVYAPASRGQCFWVEQRSYGRAAQPRPARLMLSDRNSFHTLQVPIDAWFQPNPSTAGSDHWFSGGVRRTVRHGPCPIPSSEGVGVLPAR